MACRAVTSIVSELGGPSINPVDIEWALDIPAGKQLIHWLAEQLGHETSGLGASLRCIALEAEEVKMLKSSKITPERREHDVYPMPPGYVLPSERRRRALRIQEESELLSNEAVRVQERSRLVKLATQEASQTIEALRTAIESTDSEIKEARERLRELSLLADSAIISSSNAAHRLVDNLSNQTYSAKEVQSSPRPVSLVINPQKALNEISTLRTTISDASEANMRCVDSAENALPTAVEVEQEAKRLCEAFIAIEKEVYLRELANAYELMEKEGAIAEDDASGSSQNNADAQDDLDVGAELERAWNLDMAGIISARGAVLDATTGYFSTHVLPPLQKLQATLQATENQTHEAEALISALTDEIGELTDDVRDARTLAAQPRNDQNAEDQLYESALMELLKKLTNFRSPDAPPAILLDRTDVLNELQTICAQEKLVQDAEMRWTQMVEERLDDLTSAQAPFLNAVYRHAPMNTSPPFAPPAHVRKLEREATEILRDVERKVAKLQVDAEASSRTKAKLNKFVQRWSSES